MELIKLTTQEFGKLAKLVYDRTGIHLPEEKITLLSNRLRKRLRALDLSTFAAYYKLLQDPVRSKEELPDFLSAVTTNETYFFRNEGLWKFIREQWLPNLTAQKRKRGNLSIRVWSAAASSGEEAYTTAICLREGIADFSKWKIHIIASDISERVLSKARAGVYDDYAVSKMPEKLLAKWFDVEDKNYCIKSELRDLVKVQTHNLRDAFPNRNFDLVFLRNVLMYFDTPMKQRVLKTVKDALQLGGHLIVGDVDPIRHTPELSEKLALEYIGPNVYHKPERVAVAAMSGRNGGS